MKIQNNLRRLAIFSITFIIITVSVISSSIDVFAKEEYRLEFFNQLADKVTSLYYREAIVGLDILEDIYGDPNLIINIEKALNKDPKTKDYLLEKGFDIEKISEILNFIDDFFPSIADMKSESNTNMLKRLINTALVEENTSLSYTDYEEDIEVFGRKFYEILPEQVKDDFDIYFEEDTDKRDAIIKIVVEFIYSGHGTSVYSKSTKEYIDLKLMTDDSFIKQTNKELGIEFLNYTNKRAIDIVLKALEKTIKDKELDDIYSDLSSVLNLVDTNYSSDKREEALLQKPSIIKPVSKDITRAEVLKLALSSLNIEPKEDINIEEDGFKDIDKGDFYSSYIVKGKSIGIISGYNDNTFRPNDKVTISEAMSIISNAIDYKNGNVKLSEIQIDDALEKLVYGKDIEIWARESVAKLIIKGFLKNDSDKKFGDGGFLTRDEAMHIIDKIKTSQVENK